MSTQPTPCPYCRSIVEVNITWAIKNGRVFCNSCCKAFDIRVGEEETEEVPEVKKDEKIEKALVELEREMDDAIEDFEVSFLDDYWD